MSAFRQSMLPSTIRKAQRVADTPYKLLETREIADSMNLIVTGFLVSEDLLTRPTSHFVVAVYSELVAYFVGVTEEMIRNSLLEAATGTDVQDDAENTLANTFALMRHITKFLTDCGVDDFNIMDMTKPESPRLRKHLSAVVAYAHFRESRMADHDLLIKQCQDENDRFRDLWRENEDLMEQINEIERLLRENSLRMKETQAHNSEVEAELRRLKKVQELLTEEYASYKDEKKTSTTRHDELRNAVKSMRAEIDRIRKYLVESPELLHQSNVDLQNSIESQKSALFNMEKKARDVDITIVSLREITNDLRACLKVVEDCEEAVSKEQEATRRLAYVEERLEQRHNDSSNLDIRLAQLHTQLGNSVARIKRAREQAEQKRESAEAKMRELRELQGEVIAERTMLSKQMDEKRVYIELQERKMKLMKEDLDREMKLIAAETEKLQSHIELYLETMGSRVLDTV